MQPVQHPFLVPLLIVVVAGVLLFGRAPVTVIAAYAAVAALLAVALRAPTIRRAALAGIGVVLLLASLRPEWGVARNRDVRYHVSLTTVTQVFDPAAPTRPPRTCSWLTGRGPEALCAPDPGRQRRFFLLATAPALIGIAILLGTGATAPGRQPGTFQLLLMATSFATLGVLMVLLNAGAGLAVLRGATLRFSGTGLIHAALGVPALIVAMREARRSPRDGAG